MNKPFWSKELDLAKQLETRAKRTSRYHDDHFVPVTGIHYRDIKCMHETCPNCHGTGTDGLGNACIHMISCPCPKCTPRC